MLIMSAGAWVWCGLDTRRGAAEGCQSRIRRLIAFAPDVSLSCFLVVLVPTASFLASAWIFCSLSPNPVPVYILRCCPVLFLSLFPCFCISRYLLARLVSLRRPALMCFVSAAVLSQAYDCLAIYPHCFFFGPSCARGIAKRKRRSFPAWMLWFFPGDNFAYMVPSLWLAGSTDGALSEHADNHMSDILPCTIHDARNKKISKLIFYQLPINTGAKQ